MTAKILQKEFRYTNAAKSDRPGYLYRKWQRLYPGCFAPPPQKAEAESEGKNVTPIKRKK